MHREILLRVDPSFSGETDHRDRNPLNNTRENLRPATYTQNTANRGPKKANLTGFKGVGVERKYRNDGTLHIRFKAEFQLNGRRHHIGKFKTAEEAARAYDAAARQHHGEFAYQNFPQA